MLTVPANCQITPSQPTPRVEVINFQEQSDRHEYQFDTGYPGESFSCSDDYNAYGTDNFHQDLDLDPEGSGETEIHYDENDHVSGYFVQAPSVKQFSCATCYTRYLSRNKLFKHFRDMKHQTTSNPTIPKHASVFTTHVSGSPRIIVSKAPAVNGSGLAFRTSKYLEIGMRAQPSGKDHQVCLDTGCGMTCFDRKFVSSHYPNAIIQKIPAIEIRGLGNKVHLSDEYAVIDLYFPGYQGKDSALGKIPPRSTSSTNCPAKHSSVTISQMSKGLRLTSKNANARSSPSKT
jgi:hypothetical protein